MLLSILFVIAIFCSSFVIYGFLDEGEHWGKLSLIEAIALSGLLYLLSFFLFYEYYTSTNLVMLKFPAASFTIASVVLLGIFKGKFQNQKG